MIKQIAMLGILGLALVLATAVCTQSAAASSHSSSTSSSGSSVAGINGGQTSHGLTTACAANTNVGQHNPNCVR